MCDIAAEEAHLSQYLTEETWDLDGENLASSSRVLVAIKQSIRRVACKTRGFQLLALSQGITRVLEAYAITLRSTVSDDATRNRTVLATATRCREFTQNLHDNFIRMIESPYNESIDMSDAEIAFGLCEMAACR